MAYSAPPARTEISDTYPNPSNAVARVGFGKLWDYVTGLLGATGSPPAARTALGLVIGTDVQAYSGTLASYATVSTLGFKNRIINGGMVIDQRNAGAAWGTSINGYTVDRWACLQSVTGKLNGGQNYNSITPPVGFTKYIGVQSQSAYSVGSSDYYFLYQPIEGYNVADLGFGAAGASTITVSFWVRSSLTGSFGGAIKNSGGTRSYPFSYTISSANTWEQKTVTIAGDTTGTWATDNTQGMQLALCLGSGSTRLGTANTWAGANYDAPTGSTSVVGTSGATFYITGVQLEKGNVTTSFDWRPYGTELALCQRYYQKIIGSNATMFGYWDASNAAIVGFPFTVTMRTTPTSVGVSNVADFIVNNSTIGNPTTTAITLNRASASTLELALSVASGGSSNGKACRLIYNSSSAYIELLGSEL